MNKTLEIIVDLRGACNEADVVYRFYKAFDIFGLVSEVERAQRVRDNVPANWDAFADDLSRLDGSSLIVSPLVNRGELDEVVVYLEGFREIAHSISRDVRNLLADIFLLATDRTDAQAPYDLWVKVRS